MSSATAQEEEGGSPAGSYPPQSSLRAQPKPAPDRDLQRPDDQQRGDPHTDERTPGRAGRSFPFRSTALVRGCALPRKHAVAAGRAPRRGKSTPAVGRQTRAPDGHLNSRFATLVSLRSGPRQRYHRGHPEEKRAATAGHGLVLA